VEGRVHFTHQNRNRKQREREERKGKGNKEKGVMRTWEPAAMVCGRMRKASFHVCCSQIDTGTCDMFLKCDEKVRSTQKKTEKEKEENKTQHNTPG
jgi:hypothetical protein